MTTSCASSATFDEIEVTISGGTALRYDAAGKQFVQNWQTPKAAGSCYKVTVSVGSASQAALFKLR